LVGWPTTTESPKLEKLDAARFDLWVASNLSDQRRKSDQLYGKTAVEADIERTLADLLSGKEASEPVRTAKKIIKTADSETTITYELQVNPRTGQQEVVEHIATTKEECARCGRYTSQRRQCHRCGLEVCGSCITTYETSLSYLTVCKSCYEGLPKH